MRTKGKQWGTDGSGGGGRGRSTEDSVEEEDDGQGRQHPSGVDQGRAGQQGASSTCRAFIFFWQNFLGKEPTHFFGSEALYKRIQLWNSFWHMPKEFVGTSRRDYAY